MKTISYNSVIKQLSLASVLVAMPMLVTASPTEQDSRGVGGTIVCGGSHFNRKNNTEAHRTTYVLRNFNTDLSIYIDRMTIYDATGAVIVEHNGASLPVSFNSVLGGGDNSLDPFQSAQYQSSDLVGAPLAKNRRPIQIHIDWSADARALIPEFVGVRTGRRTDGTNTFEERGRHLKECRSVSVEQGLKKGHDKD